MKLNTKFVPCFEPLIKKYNFNTAGIFGRIYLYSESGKDKCYRGSIQRLANENGLSYATAFKAVQKLEADGLIEDITPKEFLSKTQVRHYRPCLDVLEKIDADKTKEADKTKKEPFRKGKDNGEKPKQETPKADKKTEDTRPIKGFEYYLGELVNCTEEFTGAGLYMDKDKSYEIGYFNTEEEFDEYMASIGIQDSW